MSDFAIIRPVAITDAKLVSSVTEPSASDPPAWNAATTYGVGQQVHLITTHKVYQRIVAGTTATSPSADTVNWVEVGPTNRWAMFDSSTSTQTDSDVDEEITLTLTPGSLADYIVFDNVDADSIRVQVGTTYDQTVTLRTRGVANWWEFYYEPFTIKDVALFLGLPLFTTNVIQVTIFKAGGNAKIGSCVTGLSKILGTTELGASLGITDYSVKESDEWGNISVVERAFSKRMSVDVFVENIALDDIIRTLTRYRAKPLVWIGGGAAYGSMTINGYYRSFEVVVAYTLYSWLRIEIEGLS